MLILSFETLTLNKYKVGGSVKRAVHNAIMTRRYLVKSASEYAECAQAITKSIHVLYVPSDVIDSHRSDLDATWNKAISIPATQSIHCVRTIDVGEVTLGNYTKRSHVLIQRPPEHSAQHSTTPSAHSTHPQSEIANNLKHGNFVAIPLPTERGRTVLYIASVCAITGRQLQLKFLQTANRRTNVYRDGEDGDMSIEDARNVLFVCPDPQVNMIGTARLRYRYTFEFSPAQHVLMEKYSTK